MSRRGWKVLLLAPALLLCLGSECDLAEPEDNFVTVHVSATARVKIWMPSRTTIEWVGAQVEFEAVKAGGERVVKVGHTGAGGVFGPLEATFKVYREQPVEVRAKVIGGILPPELDEEPWDVQKHGPSSLAYDVLPWGRIHLLMGKEYYWYPDVDAIVDLVPISPDAPTP